MSSLEGAQDVWRERRPVRVISLLAGDEETPQFDGLAPESHLKLCVDAESCARTIDEAARRRAGEIIRFMSGWDGEGDILVHCKRGISRSTAAAFIIMCMQRPGTPEADLLAHLRARAVYADPCPLLVAYADELLGRDGAMIDAVDDLPPPCPSISAPTSMIDIGINAIGVSEVGAGA
ncbi:MAG: hypothetical protein KDA46_10305 [Parvularculaceae bacterium]|nr:hypothetical protein [Parvularculaceae bacterium]